MKKENLRWYFKRENVFLIIALLYLFITSVSLISEIAAYTEMSAESIPFIDIVKYLFQGCISPLMWVGVFFTLRKKQDKLEIVSTITATEEAIGKTAKVEKLPPEETQKENEELKKVIEKEKDATLKALNTKKKDELMDIAKLYNLNVDKKIKKADLIVEIKKAATK